MLVADYWENALVDARRKAVILARISLDPSGEPVIAWLDALAIYDQNGSPALTNLMLEQDGNQLKPADFYAGSDPAEWDRTMGILSGHHGDSIDALPDYPGPCAIWTAKTDSGNRNHVAPFLEDFAAIAREVRHHPDQTPPYDVAGRVLSTRMFVLLRAINLGRAEVRQFAS